MSADSQVSEEDIPIEIVEEKTLFIGEWLGARQVTFRHRHPSGQNDSTKESTPKAKEPIKSPAVPAKEGTKPAGPSKEGNKVQSMMMKEGMKAHSMMVQDATKAQSMMVQDATKPSPIPTGEKKQPLSPTSEKKPSAASPDKKPSAPSQLSVWQVAYRTKRPKTAKVDGVSVIATLVKTGQDGKKLKFLVLVKQFRVPIMKYSLEFPAGLLDKDETAVQAGLRELKEETGYTATKVLGTTHGIQTLDPGLTDDSVNFVIVEIDGDALENDERRMFQCLDDEERIEVQLVPFDRILEKFSEYTEQGIYVEAMVYSFGIGIVFKDGQAPPDALIL